MRDAADLRTPPRKEGGERDLTKLAGPAVGAVVHGTTRTATIGGASVRRNPQPVAARPPRPTQRGCHPDGPHQGCRSGIGPLPGPPPRPIEIPSGGRARPPDAHPAHGLDPADAA